MSLTPNHHNIANIYRFPKVTSFKYECLLNENRSTELLGSLAPGWGGGRGWVGGGGEGWWGFPYLEIEKFLGFLVFGFLFLGFFVSCFQSFTDLPDFHLMLSGRY